METSVHKVQRLAAIALATVLAGASASQAVTLTNGGLITSWENGDPLSAEGWYTPSWATYTYQNGTADWTASTDVATQGSRSLKLVYTPNASQGNFNWGARFESWSLPAEAKTAWEAPWREALTDNPANYSLTFDVIYRTKGPGKDGIPQPPGWGANLSVSMDWDSPAASGGSSGWTQFNSLGFSNVTTDNVVTVKIPMNTMIGATNGKQLPADFYWVQLNFGPNGGWTPGEQVAFYFDNLRIVQDVFPPSLVGDTNDDGVVDLTDLNNVLNNFGATGTNPGDDNGDSVVDLTDLNNVLNNFGATGATGAASGLSAVPEPASVGLLGVAGAAVLLRGRRRAK